MAEARTVETRFDRMEPWKRSLVLGGVFAVLVLLIFIFLEGAVRVRAFVKSGYGKPFYGIERLYDDTSGLRQLRAGYKDGFNRINSLGFKGPEIAADKPAGTYRVAFLGGSTTFGGSLSGVEYTWPYLVTEDLKKAMPERAFDYVNASAPGYRVGGSLERFRLQVAPLDPDLVVIYHATNDLKINSQDEAGRRGVLGYRGDEGLSWLSQYSLLVYLVEKNLRILRLQWEANEDGNKLDVPMSVLTQPFEENYRTLVRTVKATGAQVATVTFCARVRSSQSEAERTVAADTALYLMPYLTLDRIVEGYDAYNEVIRKVAREEGAILIEGADAVPGDGRHFVDSVHFTDEGSARFAARVSATLIEALQSAPPAAVASPAQTVE